MTMENGGAAVAEETTSQQGAGSPESQGQETTSGQENQGGERLWAGKYETPEAMEQGVLSQAELLAQLKAENETLRNIAMADNGEERREPAPESGGPASKSPNPSFNKDEFTRLWNSGDMAGALEHWQGASPRVKALESQLREARLVADRAGTENALRAYESDPRMPRFKELAPEMDRIATERMTLNPGYNKSFKTKEDLALALYAEAALRKGPAKPAGNGGGALNSIAGGGSRGRAPAPSAPKPKGQSGLSPDIRSRFGIRHNPRQNVYDPATQRLIDGTTALEALEAEALVR